MHGSYGLAETNRERIEPTLALTTSTCAGSFLTYVFY